MASLNHVKVASAGYQGVAIGTSSAASGNYAIAIGASAIVNGGESVAIGSGATSTAGNCISIGQNANSAHGTGIAIGAGATSHNQGTAIGSGAVVTYFHGVAIGDRASCGYRGTAIGARTVAGYRETRIGSVVGGITKIVGTQPWTNTSDARFKTDIAPLPCGLNFILDLDPIVFNFDPVLMAEFTARRQETEAGIISKYANERIVDGADVASIDARETAELADFRRQFDPVLYEKVANACHVGFSAQAVHTSLAGFGADCHVTDVPADESSEFYSLRTAQLVPFLVQAIKELSAKNDALRVRLNALMGQ